MKMVSKSNLVLNSYLSPKLSLESFQEAMRHPSLSVKQKLQITDFYFASIGSVDITDQLLGQQAVVLKKRSKNLKS
jgi:hypothetical protein